MNHMSLIVFIFVAAICFTCSNTNTEKLNLCVVESSHTIKRVHKLCPSMNEPQSPLQCVIARDRFDCLRRLANGDADVTVLEPEDLIAASMYNEYDLLVIYELRLFANEKQRFEMVAVVRRSITRITDVPRKKYCHPGIETTDAWSKALSMYLDNWLILNECNSKKTLLENKLAGLSEYFESACIPGPWSVDSEFDVQLKSKYNNLCHLCDNPADCRMGDTYEGREGAMICLTDGNGDIAWVRLEDALIHFKTIQANKEDYRYLCPDGTTRLMSSQEACVWITHPWPVIVAKREVAEKVSQVIASMINSTNDWRTDIFEGMLVAYRPVLTKVDRLEPPEDYLRRFAGFTSANNRASCRPSRRVRWCIASNVEDRKCRWLREASLVYSVEPTIACIQESSRTSCLDAIRKDEADIFVAKTEELLEVNKKDLIPLLQVTPNKTENLNRIVAIVKRNSPFKELRDLKGTKACFTGYRTIGWNSFVAVITNVSGENPECSDAKLIANFFKDSCVPDLPEKDKNVPKNLYSLCEQGKKVNDDKNALSCVERGIADVAFVNLKTIQREIDDLSNNTEYRVLCTNKEEEERTCSLAWATLGSIVTRKNTTALRREEMYSMLLELDQIFGTTFSGLTPAFSLYGSYDGINDVIFPENAQHLQREDSRIRGNRNYNEILENLMKRPLCSRATTLSMYFRIITVIALMMIILLR